MRWRVSENGKKLLNEFHFFKGISSDFQELILNHQGTIFAKGHDSPEEYTVNIFEL